MVLPPCVAVDAGSGLRRAARAVPCGPGARRGRVFRRCGAGLRVCQCGVAHRGGLSPRIVFVRVVMAVSMGVTRLLCAWCRVFACWYLEVICLPCEGGDSEQSRHSGCCSGSCIHGGERVCWSLCVCLVAGVVQMLLLRSAAIVGSRCCGLFVVPTKLQLLSLSLLRSSASLFVVFFFANAGIQLPRYGRWCCVLHDCRTRRRASHALQHATAARQSSCACGACVDDDLSLSVRICLIACACA